MKHYICSHLGEFDYYIIKSSDLNYMILNHYLLVTDGKELGTRLNKYYEIARYIGSDKATQLPQNHIMNLNISIF